MSVNGQRRTLNRTGGRGFTLIEILIVAAIISLFAGLAVISAQQFYDENKRKGIYDETSQIGRALSFAEHDLGFFPRLYLLDYPLSLISYKVSNQVSLVRPGFDTYGMALLSVPFLNPSNNVLEHWNGPYIGMNAGRTGMAQGSHGIVKMRLSDQEFQGFNPPGLREDLSVVDWPADPYGNPYMVYLVTADSTYVDTSNNPKGLRLIDRPNETANYFVAVVSYGPNGVPGGNDQTSAADLAQKAKAALYVKGDIVAGGPAKFTLKSRWAASSDLRLDPTDKAQMAVIASSIESNQSDPAKAGIRDPGSDDIFWTF